MLIDAMSNSGESEDTISVVDTFITKRGLVSSLTQQKAIECLSTAGYSLERTTQLLRLTEDLTMYAISRFRGEGRWWHVILSVLCVCLVCSVRAGVSGLGLDGRGTQSVVLGTAGTVLTTIAGDGAQYSLRFVTVLFVLVTALLCRGNEGSGSASRS